MNDRRKPFVIPVFIPFSGCPHRCLFCNQKAIAGVDKPPPAAALKDIIRRFLPYNRQQRRPVQAAFYGGNFLGLPAPGVSALLDQAQWFVDQGLIDSIRFSTRPDTIRPDTMDLISGYAVRTVELGVQSMNDDVLSLSRRGHTAGQSREALGLLKQRGLETGVQIMTGLPGDDGGPSRQTARILAGLAPDFVRIYPTVVISGSELADWYKNGRYKPAPLEDAVCLTADIYRIFQQHHIPVIRMGLQPTEELNNGATVLAGPYHPAFGHLVLSRLYLEKIIDVIDADVKTAGELTLAVHPKEISRFRGLRNSNIQYLKKNYKFQAIRIIADDALAPGQIIRR